MKNPIFYISVLFIFLIKPLMSIGQIEIHDGGLVDMGGVTGTRPTCESWIFGNAGDGYSLFVRHNNSTSNTCGIQTLVPNVNCNSYGLDVFGGSTAFYATGGGWIYCGGTWISSDSSLKIGIKKLSGTLDKLDKIHGYNYHYRTDLILDKGLEKGKKFTADTFLHAGVMATEVQQIAPYAVHEMKNGKLAVDYIQLIPFLLQGVKELDSINKQQAAQLNLLQARFNYFATNLDSSGGNYKMASASNTHSNASYLLYQNNPNPFNQQTTIGYSLNSNYTSAYIYIFDLQGGLKKSYQLNGSGNITVKSNELSAGMYLYSLVVDGNQIDIKRMLLTN